LVTAFQFLEHLSDRQAADAVRARIDWKRAPGLELADPGFHFSVLAEFRARLVADRAERLLLDAMLERFKDRGLVRARGKRRADSTRVPAAVHDPHLLELAAETPRAALDDPAAAVPGWLRGVARPAWFERHARRAEEHRLPSGREAREAPALGIGADGFFPPDGRPGGAERAGGGPRGAGGAGPGRGSAGAPRARWWRAAAMAGRRGAAPGGRAAAVAPRPGRRASA
jgi:transposase